jgi:hypothetical protein
MSTDIEEIRSNDLSSVNELSVKKCIKNSCLHTTVFSPRGHWGHVENA